MTLGAIGWTVVHSLWQGTFIAGVAAMAFGLMRSRSAHARYLAGCICLALMVVLPAATAFTSLRPLRASLAPRLMPVVDAAVDLPAFAWWASVLVPMAGGLWLVAAAVRTVSVAREFRRSRTLRRFVCSPAARGMRAMTADLAAKMRIRCPDVRTNPDATVPMVLGWRQPVILVPADMETWLRPDQIRAVLAHELEHVRRNDYPVNALQVVADTLLVHHPAARWLSRRIRTEREYCCDDVAARAARNAADYARALARLEDARCHRPLVVAAGSGMLLDRIQRIVGHPRQVLTPYQGAAVLALTSIVAVLMLCAAMAVPQGLPFGAQLKRRMPTGGAEPVPTGPSFPRRPAPGTDEPPLTPREAPRAR